MTVKLKLCVIVLGTVPLYYIHSFCLLVGALLASLGEAMAAALYLRKEKLVLASKSRLSYTTQKKGEEGEFL